MNQWIKITVASLALMLCWPLSTLAQDGAVQVSPTPVRVVIPTLTMLPTEFTLATPTSTRTPTPEGPVMLQVRPEAGEVNVRSEPDPTGEQVGSLRPGEMYPVTGRYFRWIRLDYEIATDRIIPAWVFDELVEIVGDEAEVPQVDFNAAPTADGSILDATLTADAIALVPGGDLTATASVRILSAPSGPVAAGDNASNAVPNAVLPTFTYPPDIVAMAPTADAGAALEPTAVGDALDVLGDAADVVLPPIVPIGILAGLAVLGLAVNALRR